MSETHEDKATDDQPEAPSEEKAPAEQPIEETRIIIRPDGEVVIENLTELMTEVALDLDPDSPLSCRIETADDAEETDRG